MEQEFLIITLFNILTHKTEYKAIIVFKIASVAQGVQSEDFFCLSPLELFINELLILSQDRRRFLNSDFLVPSEVSI